MSTNTKYIDGVLLDKAKRRALGALGVLGGGGGGGGIESVPAGGGGEGRPTVRMPVGQALHLQAECLWGGAIEDLDRDPQPGAAGRRLP